MDRNRREGLQVGVPLRLFSPHPYGFNPCPAYDFRLIPASWRDNE